ncbi:AraC family ligand binding domain-containing protein [Cohnella ginsengisoli]|uniref:AraC family ligand binding domain-containing protein n=1 Tax=Cohnella ginsengisoli TaxID=425004 RepID=A0A9X4KKU0_9BACL|nr:AraC family ligand binding domain-containing protein [Cohnella ginsengisoli]MDG0791505.1 AraC family ligand binding domain-containing protein [Cohnella ginsengisoli]
MKKSQYTLRGNDLFRGDLRVYVNRIEENFVDSALHEHDFIELNYVAEGAGYQYIGEQVVPATRGDLFVLPVGRSHVFRPYSADKRSRLVVYNVVFAPSLLTEIAMTAPELMLDKIVAAQIEDAKEAGIAKDKRLALEPLFERIHEEHAALRPGASAMLTALLTQILIEWTRLREKAAGAESPRGRRPRLRRSRRLRSRAGARAADAAPGRGAVRPKRTALPAAVRPAYRPDLPRVRPAPARPDRLPASSRRAPEARRRRGHGRLPGHAVVYARVQAHRGRYAGAVSEADGGGVLICCPNGLDSPYCCAYRDLGPACGPRRRNWEIAGPFIPSTIRSLRASARVRSSCRRFGETIARPSPPE